MVKVTKSPNIMSTTGRSPVMAAPTASPVKPASEIGVSSTRSLPNSSKRPERTLKGVPASATSSPRMQTVASRRISSASASRIACANVSSRLPVSGIDVLCHFIDGRVRSRHGEGRCPHEDIPGRGFRVMRVFGIEIVLADVDHRKLEKLGEIHNLVQHTLAKRAFSEKTYRHAAVTETPSGECRTGGYAGAAAYDRIRSQVASGRVRNVHGAALALAVPGLFSQQFGEHLIRGSAFRQTMSMTAMRTGDVSGSLERFTYTHRNCFLPYVKMPQAGHQCPCVKFVDLAFKLADGNHLPVHPEPQLDFFRSFARLGRGRHFCSPVVTVVATPDRRARTSNITAKSSFSQPMALAAVKNSLLTAVVGTGTLSLRPNSIASRMSFCIMFTSNHASSRCCKTNGPRYCIIGD